MINSTNAPSSKPWKSWIPGVLSKHQMRELIEGCYIKGTNTELLDNSSLDLRLADEGYVMVQGSVKPRGNGYLESLKQDNLVKKLTPESDGTFKLCVRHTYLFPLQEKISELQGSGIFGQATAKSSVGRMDVLARLIVDGMDVYESFDHSKLETGDMYVELTPMTFNVVVKPNIPLVQLRFFRGRPEDSIMGGDELYECVLTDTVRNDGSLSVDLTPIDIADNPVIAFRADQGTKDTAAIKLWDVEGQGRANPEQYWNFETSDDGNGMLKIKQNDFYIMRSKEKIHVPRGIAVYCRATDETIGEMRIHYAGFVHPFFGSTSNPKGTPLIFEVRGHDVDVTLCHQEKMANLIFYRMSMDCTDADYDGSDKTYDTQTLMLSKFFAPWPESST